mmetsp:Transcript_8062/g.18208  ORF Transcript_8062/g.18208 Transcript_8062/m.18208 type:complete len:496 (+) Transcript_8062:270-1757(+)|eukprot:CAMPEP_0172301536 /NCGR_PEP_ID=MMETSP1058-20130122/3403_1 /TAXON_ID=83371 /ORGANISM="Detonula confervacea, Strain CCMP 353" /LENGTH=495 /DNA_ID=CAMNT_0013011681 /DNA_START=177 /DNA_END=1664 /DNA_ORIENTATION=+
MNYQSVKRISAIAVAAIVFATSPICRAFPFQPHQQQLVNTNVQTISHGGVHRTKLIPTLTNTALHASFLEGLGVPSNPGWRRGRLNRLSDWAESTTANRPIVLEYEPSELWLWKKWQGTVLQMTLRSCLIQMGVGIILDWSVRSYMRSTSSLTWSLLSLPPSSEPLIQSMFGLKKLWEYQLTVTTFILTFFLSHAYGYWQTIYSTTRKIQGRINDICMLLVVGAKRSFTSSSRTPETNGTNGENVKSDRGEFTQKSEKLVKLCTRLIRLSHTFFWAATATASNGLSDCEEFLKDAENCTIPIDNEHIGPLLLSSWGLKALVNANQLTRLEAEDLMNTELPPSQYAYILLVWVSLKCMDGMEKGILRGGNGFEENLLRQLTALRATMFDIDDFRAGRMPLAYVQLVQVMVDTLVVLSPFALYAELGSLSIPLVGILTLFFRGLLKLSKSFLDPFGVEGFAEQNIRVDVLVSELNFGASKRWIRAAGKTSGRRRLSV